MSQLTNLINQYSNKNLIAFLRDKLPSFKPDDENLDHLFQEEVFDKYESIEKIGEATINKDDVIIIASETTEPLTERTGKKNQYEIAKKILKHEVKDAALFVFYDSEGNFRFSFVKANYLGTKREFTEYKRYTYFVSPNQTNKTFIKQVGSCSFSSLDEIIEAFSVEPLNKQFYQEIAKAFYELIGGKYKQGTKTINADNPQLVLPSTPLKDNRKIYQEFAVRLIGRTIFCWFLKNKKSEAGIPLIPETWLSSNTVVDVNNQQHDYYHSVLEKLFFLVLNKREEDRKDYTLPQDANIIPFLNGGLFEAHPDDFFPTDSQGIHQISFGLKIPNSWFLELFKVLEQYNFTIDENSIYDAEVSIDPEMLGTIFENLLAEIDPDTEKSARKATGSFYTPREIVDYMVEQSLVQYLKTKTAINDEEALERLFKEGQETNQEDTFNSKQKDQILQALSDVKILDPACGSGAFPMGALHKIILALKKLDPGAKWWKQKLIDSAKNAVVEQYLKEKFDSSNSDYARKLGVIQHSIYGVDIQPIASEISKLRSFLSLVIDENIDDKAENRGIWPLPNLEFKFVTANTLIGLEEKNISVIDFGQTEDLQNQLQELRNNYLQANPEDKEQLKVEFKNLQTQIYKQELANSGQNKRAQQLYDWKPFDNKDCKWFDPQWMFGVEKFDIIIGNPPYIGQKGNKEKFQMVKESTLGAFHQRRMDYFYFFFHFAIEQTSDNAVISFITTNYYLTATYSDKLREHIFNKTDVLRLLNFNEYKLFNSATGQHNLITILSKGKNKLQCKSSLVKLNGLYNNKDLNSILRNDFETNSFFQSQDELFEKDTFYIRIRNYSNNSLTVNDVLDKISSQNKALKDFLNIEQGVLSGADKVTKSHIKKYNLKGIDTGEGIYILNKDEVDSLNLTQTERQQFIKPIYKNSDIKKWYFEPIPTEFVIYIKSEGGFNEIPSNIKKHLSRYKEILVNRNLRAGTTNSLEYDSFVQGKKNLSYVMNANSMKVGNYFCISYARNGKDTFERLKIVNSRRAKSNVFAIQDSNFYEQSDIVVSTLKKEIKNENILIYLCALLNSKLYFQWFYHRGKRKGDTLELFQQPLKELPVNIENESIFNTIVGLFEKVKSEKENNNYIDKIDILIYKLYNLTYQEVLLIDPAFSLTEEAYNNYNYIS